MDMKREDQEVLDQVGDAVREEGKKAYSATEKTVTGVYHAIEDTVVGAYKAVEDGFVGTWHKVEDFFVEKLFVRDGETVEEAKERMRKAAKH